MITRRQYLNNHKRVKKGAKSTKLGRRLIAAARQGVEIARDVSENEIHMKAWQWVFETHPGLLIFHVANERQTTVQHHRKLQRLGVLSGVADFLAFPRNGRKFAIELKDAKGIQSDTQKKFQRHWTRTGGGYVIVRSVAEFQQVINGIVLFND